MAVLAGAGLLVAGQGGVETYQAPGSFTDARPKDAPAWTDPCWRGKPERIRARARTCIRLDARVIWVSNEDPEHGGDAHLVTVADRRIEFAKITPDDRAAGVPGIGRRVTLVGVPVRGAHLEEQLWVWEVAR